LCQQKIGKKKYTIYFCKPHHHYHHNKSFKGEAPHLKIKHVQ